jgi:zinc transport system substrate-binding protein
MCRILVAALLAALAAGCQEAPPTPGKPIVVATFYPLYEFARQVAGDRAEVVSLVPPGVEPHDWEPSPQQVVDVQRAHLFVYNGAGFEPWVDKLLNRVAGGKTVSVDATKGMALLRHGDTVDPHVWLDPVLAQDEVEAIRAGLAHVDAAHATAYADNARAFKARLAALDQAFSVGLSDCETRDILTSHAAFSYLARRYRLTLISVMGLTPEAEPGPSELATIVRHARRQKIRYIFAETLVSSRLAEALAREIGARTLLLNPIEGLTKEESAAGKGYVALMEANLANLRTGLGCK